VKKKSKVAIDVSGLDEESRRKILKAIQEQQQNSQSHSREPAKIEKKRRVINMNYPPEDISKEELQRFWGEPEPKEDAEFVKSLRARKVKKRYKPSPV